MNYMKIEEIKIYMPAVLAIVITIGYFIMLVVVSYTSVDKVNPVQLQLMGGLSTAWVSVISYWVGTTNSSSRKTEIIAKAQPVDDTKT